MLILRILQNQKFFDSVKVKPVMNGYQFYRFMPILIAKAVVI